MKSVEVALIELAGHAFWPVVALTAIVAFKGSIVSLLDRLAEFDWSKKRAVFQKAAAAPPPASDAVQRAIFETGADGFLTDKARKLIVEGSKLEEGPSVVGELLIYSNLSQRTWLVATAKNLYVLLDDPETRQSSQVVQTFFPKGDVLPLSFAGDSPLIKFAAEDDWGWFYSPEMFSREKLRRAIKRLVS